MFTTKAQPRVKLIQFPDFELIIYKPIIETEVIKKRGYIN